MTLSELRRRIDALKRKFARELAIIKLRRCLKDARRKGEVPDPESIVLSLLPWAGNDRYFPLLRWDLPPRPSSPPLLPF